MSFPENPHIIKPRNPAEICDLINNFFDEAERNGNKVNYRMSGDRSVDRVVRFKCEVVTHDIVKGEDVIDKTEGPNLHRAARLTYSLRDIWVPFVVTNNYRYFHPLTATIERKPGKLVIDDNDFMHSEPFKIFGFSIPRPW